MMFLWLMWLASMRVTQEPATPLRVSGGLLRGSLAYDGSHMRYLSVPYATVPHRFQDSVPHPPWEGVLEADDSHVRCPQRTTSSMVVGHEDCLTLNVYTPARASQELRPVMVFIHGGGFKDGSGDRLLYGPDYLIRRDVILVTINYRLDVLGFLCLGIKQAPGNMGMKDQVLALKWVKENIKAFKGDPDNVTIFGESAGSASVSYHLISPMSRGLFKRAIMESGSALSFWAFQPEPLKIASSFAKQMQYNTDDPEEIYKILMTKSVNQLLSTRVPRAAGDIVQSENIFVPCLEREIPGVERFLTDFPYNLILKGQYQQVPMIIGYNSAEGYRFVGKENDTTLSKVNFYEPLTRDLSFPTEEDRNRTALRLKELYMGDDEISRETLAKFSRFEGEYGISYPVTITADLFTRTNDADVYTYMFSYDGLLNMAKLVSGLVREPGATHADELFYLFKPRLSLESILEKHMIEQMTTMWTNFAKFGTPTPSSGSAPVKWAPTRAHQPRLLVIDRQLSTAPLWGADTLRFWNETYSKYRRNL